MKFFQVALAKILLISTADAFLVAPTPMSNGESVFTQQGFFTYEEPQLPRNSFTRLNYASGLPDTSDPLAILNLEPDVVDIKEIKKAYRRMALKYHPDTFTSSDASEEEKQKANDEFARINAAYAFLTGKSEDMPEMSESEKQQSKKKGYARASKRYNNHSRRYPNHRERKQQSQQVWHNDVQGFDMSGNRVGNRHKPASPDSQRSSYSAKNMYQRTSTYKAHKRAAPKSTTAGKVEKDDIGYNAKFSTTQRKPRNDQAAQNHANAGTKTNTPRDTTSTTDIFDKKEQKKYDAKTINERISNNEGKSSIPRQSTQDIFNAKEKQNVQNTVIEEKKKPTVASSIPRQSTQDLFNAKEKQNVQNTVIEEKKKPTVASSIPRQSTQDIFNAKEKQNVQNTVIEEKKKPTVASSIPRQSTQDIFNAKEKQNVQNTVIEEKKKPTVASSIPRQSTQDIFNAKGLNTPSGAEPSSPSPAPKKNSLFNWSPHGKESLPSVDPRQKNAPVASSIPRQSTQDIFNAKGLNTEVEAEPSSPSPAPKNSLFTWSPHGKESLPSVDPRQKNTPVASSIPRQSTQDIFTSKESTASSTGSFSWSDNIHADGSTGQNTDSSSTMKNAELNDINSREQNNVKSANSSEEKKDVWHPDSVLINGISIAYPSDESEVETHREKKLSSEYERSTFATNYKNVIKKEETVEKKASDFAKTSNSIESEKEIDSVRKQKISDNMAAYIEEKKSVLTGEKTDEKILPPNFWATPEKLNPNKSGSMKRTMANDTHIKSHVYKNTLHNSSRNSHASAFGLDETVGNVRKSTSNKSGVVLKLKRGEGNKNKILYNLKKADRSSLNPFSRRSSRNNDEEEMLDTGSNNVVLNLKKGQMSRRKKILSRVKRAVTYVGIASLMARVIRG
ncbi:hypothetical protein CTEN210_05399 [Chaetoceros tenuissimus]|uniref:J domain-containing protein n=1 Tax=Chaetoceros tenuissimus TaxID=426638 RepID=A0AAD3CMY7_9STRA|nr:hypothetical protein CTEN210_05399 [Chaetoceros tenuissimus]